MIYALSTYVSYAATTSKTLNVYGWANYIEPKLIKQFEAETGISVIYDVFDSEEMLDAKIMLGHTGYDIVFPSSGPSLSNQINENIYLPLDKNKIKAYQSLNKDILEKVSQYDPNNAHVIPWLWGVTGIGYNKNILTPIVKDNTLKSLDIVFNPKILKEISDKCKIEWFFSPSEMIGLALLYQGISPHPLTAEKLLKAKQTLQEARPYISKISNSTYNIDLIKGNSCLAVGWLNDIAQTVYGTDNKDINLSLVTQGFFISIDNIAIPRDAKNIENAYQFINFLLKPEISGQISNYTTNLNTNKDSYSYIKKQLVNNKNLNPPDNILKNGYTLTNKSVNLVRLQNRIWTYIVSNIKE
jgi:putrescine transport system substrate-binding protein